MKNLNIKSIMPFVGNNYVSDGHTLFAKRN